MKYGDMKIDQTMLDIIQRAATTNFIKDLASVQPMSDEHMGIFTMKHEPTGVLPMLNKFASKKYEHLDD